MSSTSIGHLIRPTSPKSPVASVSAFESVEGSDDEDNINDNAALDTTYMHSNGNAVSKVDKYKLLPKVHIHLPSFNFSLTGTH